MNRACDSCGKIITVPDIPLPEDYTQKCTFCGHNNAVNDSGFSAAPELDWDTLDSSSSFLSGPVPMTEKPEKGSSATLARDFEQRLRDLETRLRAEWNEKSREQKNQGPDAFDIALANHVVEGAVLVGTSHPGMYSSVERILIQDGYTTEECAKIDQLMGQLTGKPHQIIILDQGFLKTGDGGKQALKYIKNAPLAVRRCQTVLLITPKIPTGEPQAFIQWGIDLNINPRDLSQLSTLLSQLTQTKRTLLTPYLAGSVQDLKIQQIKMYYCGCFLEQGLKIGGVFFGVMFQHEASFAMVIFGKGPGDDGEEIDQAAINIDG